ncbi:hypothetical protein Taro_040928 [Colocasia esculenta]|uniref:Uncharacterized protein n=1 Tax=Colocasia esculenta TaxID=4460 RepID=A0A843WUD6_COLES|nr:hypothetical protein [Colocasia esculenta]
MGRGKFKGKPTGRRQFSTPEEMQLLVHVVALYEMLEMLKLTSAVGSERRRFQSRRQKGDGGGLWGSILVDLLVHQLALAPLKGKNGKILKIKNRKNRKYLKRNLRMNLK